MKDLPLQPYMHPNIFLTCDQCFLKLRPDVVKYERVHELLSAVEIPNAATFL